MNISQALGLIHASSGKLCFIYEENEVTVELHLAESENKGLIHRKIETSGNLILNYDDAAHWIASGLDNAHLTSLGGLPGLWSKNEGRNPFFLAFVRGISSLDAPTLEEMTEDIRRNPPLPDSCWDNALPTFSS